MPLCAPPEIGLVQIVGPEPPLRQAIILAAVDLEQIQCRAIRKDSASVAKIQFS